jgi:hypothetical protein
MIGRLANLALGAILYFSLGTLIAEGIMIGYVWSKWNLDRDKVAQVVAVARGLESAAATQAAAEPVREETAAEQASYAQVLELRAAKDKNLQLREQALANAAAQMQAERQKLADDEKRYKLDRADYESKLAAKTKEAKSTGQDEVRHILESVKSKQAKEFLQGMLDNKELDDVVVVLSAMADSKRAKILAEFKTPDEIKKIEEVLTLIRKGAPEAPLARQAMEKLQPPAPETR